MIRLFGTGDDLLAVLTTQWANEQLGLDERMQRTTHTARAGKQQNNKKNVCTIE